MSDETQNERQDDLSALQNASGSKKEDSQTVKDEAFEAEDKPRLNLSEIQDSALNKIVFAAGWDIKHYDGTDVDLDLSALMYGRDGRTREDRDFVFYNNLASSGEEVVHSGDNRTGAGEGDDETIVVDLTKIPFEVMGITFVVTIHEGDLRRQNFSIVDNAFLRIVNYDTDYELARIDIPNIEDERSESTGLIFGSLERAGQEWIFIKRLDSVNGGLAQIATDFGIIVVE